MCFKSHALLLMLKHTYNIKNMAIKVWHREKTVRHGATALDNCLVTFKIDWLDRT